MSYLTDPSFHGVNRLFVLPFENETDREVHTKYYLPNVEIKDCNVIIDGINLFDKPIKNNLKTYDNIRKISTGQRDDYLTGCLLDYTCFKEHYKVIAIYLSEQKKLDADPKATQQINFTGNLEKNASISSIIKEVKETILSFSRGTVKVLWFYPNLI